MLALALAASMLAAPDDPGGLAARLVAEGPEALARAARAEGNPARGAILFHQATLGCARCHLVGSRSVGLGPDLSRLEPVPPAADLVGSILEPSRSIRKGYEITQIQLDDGRVVAGIVAHEAADRLVLNDPAADGRPIEIETKAIEARKVADVSLMPAGLANLLGTRQQFLDLANYVMDVAEKGPARALELRPDPALLAPPPVPEYEQDIDHAGLIAELGPDSLRRGEAIYNRVCMNCHGDLDRPGSLPNSLRFASGAFKNGGDPYRMYQTLTYGFGQMVAQGWMVPRQKYDVIHYIRETYVRPHNPSQYAPADPAYLAALPKGKGRGPEPSAAEPWEAMDYGPSLLATIEVGDDARNIAQKGIAVRLDPGPGGVSRGRQWVLYEHDTLRLAGAWTGRGFIDWEGVNFNGKHGVHPRAVGHVQLANPTGPGWANPADGRFDDPRLRGRDGRPYGPLPREWAHFEGLQHDGDREILRYTVGTTTIRESPALDESSAAPVLLRRFEIGPRKQPLVLQVAHRDATGDTLRRVGPGGAIALFGPDRTAAEAVDRPLQFDGSTSLEIDDAADFDLSRGDFSVVSRIRTRKGGSLFCETAPQATWVPDGKALFVRGGRVTFDIGWVGAVASRRRVDDGMPHDVALTYDHESGRARLYLDGEAEGEAVLRPKESLARRVVRIGYAADDFPQPQSYFDGTLAGLRFYRRTLGPDEVRDAADGRPGVVAHWEPSGVAAEAVADATGHGHDARVIRRDDRDATAGPLAAAVSPPGIGRWIDDGAGNLRLVLAEGAEPLRFTLRMAEVEDRAAAEALIAILNRDDDGPPLPAADAAGPPRWTTPLTTAIARGDESGPYAVDVLADPVANPWSAQLRFTGLDFLPGGRLAACTWDGDVWLVDGIDRPDGSLTWRRIASGLFQPLGLKVIGGAIFVTCRDQIAILRDRDGDGSVDFVESFNSDHQVTEHFHEFAMDLQTDAGGNLYYTKAARHGLPAVVPQHGTLLRVSPDGRRTDILATGFRAPNGVCVNGDGTFFVTDQEGFWLPKNRVNWVRPGSFHGNMWGYHDINDPSDEAMEPPVCWITNKFDRSPAEVIRVDSPSWGPLTGGLIELSYGNGKVHLVLTERVGDLMQGGMVALPIPPAPTGLHRGRFRPEDGHLYACGMFSWAGDRNQPGGLYRVRATGGPTGLPVGLKARKGRVELAFAEPLDPATAEASAFAVRVWGLTRSERYGSDHVDEHPLEVAGASLSADGRTVTVRLPDIQPTRGMEIRYSLRAADGREVQGVIHNTIHRLPD